MSRLMLVYRPDVPASTCPYRLLDEQGGEIAWANQFLDAPCLRQRSPRSLRIYGFDLLHFARWSQHPPRPLAELTEAALEDYVRHQLDRQPPFAPQTIHHRLGVVRSLYRFHRERDIPGQGRIQCAYTTRSPLGYGRPRRAVVQGLRLTEPQRLIVPLSGQQVARFWNSFRSFRDLALVGLMLQDGLRCCEVLALQMADVRLAEAQILVHGKGNTQRWLPLTQDIGEVWAKYLWLERPQGPSPALFLC